MTNHNPNHKTIIVDEKMHCVDCEMPKEEPHVVEAVSDDPVYGQTKHYVCSECTQDVEEYAEPNGPDDFDKAPFCNNRDCKGYGFIQI